MTSVNPSATAPPLPRPGGSFVAGLDENGLGARLGPLLVTGVLARLNDQGRYWSQQQLSQRLAQDLGDSKRLVAFGDHALGEAWARALVPTATSPAALLDQVSLRDQTTLRQLCPKRAERQCWSLLDEESFTADSSLVERIDGHLAEMRTQGVEILSVKCEVLCTRQLNNEQASGGNRFLSDLHAMERLVLEFRRLAGGELSACCGKVGGMAGYGRFFGPLSSYLHVTLEESRSNSAYRFPGVGEVHFTQDADASNPLVMLASLIGKYLRELTMARVSGFYTAQDSALPKVSGYHDPVTQRLVELSAPLRKKLGIPANCFERARKSPARQKTAKRQGSPEASFQEVRRPQ